MGTNTPRASLYKPAEVGEVVDVAQLNSNMDKIDAQLGARICTSTTRPAAPFDGMTIKETDTGAWGIWDAGTAKWMMWDNRWQDYNTSLGTVVTGTVASPAFGSTGTKIARYFRNGNSIDYEVVYQYGGAGISGGSGNIVLYMPWRIPAELQAAGVLLGSFSITLAALAIYNGSVVIDPSSSHAAILFRDTAASALQYNGLPGRALGTAGDSLRFFLRYQTTGVASGV